MITNPSTFGEDYVSPEIKMIALNGGNVLIGGSNPFLELGSGSSEDLDEEFNYEY